MLLLSQLQANEKEHNTGLDPFLNRPTASFRYCCGAGINYGFSLCPCLELAPAKPGFRDLIPNLAPVLASYMPSFCIKNSLLTI